MSPAAELLTAIKALTARLDEQDALYRVLLQENRALHYDMILGFRRLEQTVAGLSDKAIVERCPEPPSVKYERRVPRQVETISDSEYARWGGKTE